MSETNVGANLVFALRTKTVIKPMFENELETFAFGHRFANDCCQEGEHKVAPTLVLDSSILNQMMNCFYKSLNNRYMFSV